MMAMAIKMIKKCAVCKKLIVGKAMSHKGKAVCGVSCREKLKKAERKKVCEFC